MFLQCTFSNYLFSIRNQNKVRPLKTNQRTVPATTCSIVGPLLPITTSTQVMESLTSEYFLMCYVTSTLIFYLTIRCIQVSNCRDYFSIDVGNSMNLQIQEHFQLITALLTPLLPLTFHIYRCAKRTNVLTVLYRWSQRESNGFNTLNFFSITIFKHFITRILWRGTFN